MFAYVGRNQNLKDLKEEHSQDYADQRAIFGVTQARGQFSLSSKVQASGSQYSSSFPRSPPTPLVSALPSWATRLHTALASLEQRNNERALTTQVLAFLEQIHNERYLTRTALTQSTGSKAVTRLHLALLAGGDGVGLQAQGAVLQRQRHCHRLRWSSRFRM